MPLQYPPQPPTLSGDTLTISRFLANPAMVNRRIRELAANRFVGDRLFGTMPAVAAPGSQIYSTDLVPYFAKPIEVVNAGAEYPRIEMPTGAAAIASILKYGCTVPITDESVNRIGGFTLVGATAGGTLIDNALMAVILNLKCAIDKVAMVALNAAVTQTAAATVVWKTIATSDPITDTALAMATIHKGVANADGLYPGSGFDPDTVVCSDVNSAYLRSSTSIKAMMAQINNQAAQLDGTGRLSINGMQVWPTGMLPTVTKAFVVDSSNLGYYAVEVLNSPEFTGDPLQGIETFARRDPDGNDSWLVTGRRPVVPVVLNPNAAYSITGLTE